MSLVKMVSKGLTGARSRWTAFCVMCFAVALAAVPGVALATETATEEKIKAVTSQVSTEGVSIVLAVLTGLVALIAAVIIIPKAIGFIRRFV